MLNQIIDKYINSRDFNGLPIYEIDNYDEKTVAELIRQGFVEAISEREVLNPHIRGFQLQLPIDQQLENIKHAEWHTCLYPTEKALESVEINYSTPYTNEMRKGAEQFKIVFFSIEILERYVNNPQYNIWDCGYRGTICIKDEYYREGENEDYIKDYGMAYINGPVLNRAIGVFLCDLSDLTPKTQMLWKAFELENQDECKVEAGFYKNLILGQWVTKHWILQVILEAIKVINSQCRAIGLDPLFNKEFQTDSSSMPEGYRTILLPTEKNYNDFVMAIEKMIVHNISIKTFQKDVAGISAIERKNEKGEFKGSIVMLDEWLKKNVKANFDINDVIIQPLKDIRKIRQKPAHELITNTYDVEFYEKQEILVEGIFGSLRALAALFSGHPLAKSVVIPEQLISGKDVVFY